MTFENPIVLLEAGRSDHLERILDKAAEDGRAFTVGEIAAQTGYSVREVKQTIAGLIKRGDVDGNGRYYLRNPSEVRTTP